MATSFPVGKHKSSGRHLTGALPRLEKWERRQSRAAAMVTP